MAQGVRADQKIGEDAAWTRINLFTPPRGVGLKGAPGNPLYCFVEIPANGGICIPEEAPKKFPITRRVCEQLGEDWSVAPFVNKDGSSHLVVLAVPQPRTNWRAALR